MVDDADDTGTVWVVHSPDIVHHLLGRKQVLTVYTTRKPGEANLTRADVLQLRAMGGNTQGRNAGEKAGLCW